MVKIYNFENIHLSDRNGSYGGNSGDKEGVLINDEYWMIKYPKNTKEFARIGSLSYSTSPQSEFIGGHIYAILGYDVHDTLLGIRNGKVVVACKDLCDDNHRLIEFRQLKNTYNRQLSEELESSFHSTEGKHFVDLRIVMAHLRLNPELQDVPFLKERFWDCIIIDGLINNNDRNNGNWGILRNKTEKILAPVFDNGSCFSPNIPDSRIETKLNNSRAFLDSALHGVSAYSLDGNKNAKFVDLLKSGIPEINEAILRVYPRIKEHLEECKSMMMDIPERSGCYPIITGARKKEYVMELVARERYLLRPLYQDLVKTVIVSNEPTQELEEEQEILENDRDGHKSRQQDNFDVGDDR